MQKTAIPTAFYISKWQNIKLLYNVDITRHNILHPYFTEAVGRSDQRVV